MAKGKFTKKQAAFVLEYQRDFNATQAAIRAGYSKKTAGQIGEALLKKVEISNAIKDKIDKRAEKTELSIERCLLEYKRIALFDIRKCYNDDGSLKDIHELDDDTAAALQSIESDDLFDGVGKEREKIGVTRKVKANNKRDALQDVMRHLGGFEKDNAQRNDAAKAAAAAGAMANAKSAEERTRLLKTILNK